MLTHRQMVEAMSIPVDPDCFSTRLARVGRHVDRGEWASGHAILSGLRQCALRHGCPHGDNCATAAELLMGDVRSLVRDQVGAVPSHP